MDHDGDSFKKKMVGSYGNTPNGNLFNKKMRVILNAKPHTHKYTQAKTRNSARQKNKGRHLYPFPF